MSGDSEFKGIKIKPTHPFEMYVASMIGEPIRSESEDGVLLGYQVGQHFYVAEYTPPPTSEDEG